MDGRLKVCSVQVTVEDNNIEQNMKNVTAMAMEVFENEKDVDLILFHEACLEGGTPLENLTEEKCDEVVEFWRNLSMKTGMNILAGRIEREGEKLHNKGTVFSTEGEIIADYSKMHLFNSERETMTAGDALSIFELNGMKIGIMICADFGFPELSRKYALKGVHLLAVTSSWAYPDDDLWEICNRARSSENGIYVVSSDRTGATHKGIVKVGRSMCCDPDGFILANLVEKTDTYFVQNIYRSEVEKRHENMKWLEWVRPEVYEKL